jgi:hypothetical protein
MATGDDRRFVIHHHVLGRAEHWDWMLEDGPVLATWQVEAAPEVAACRAVRARRIADHRLAYLDYAGEVSGGRGTVEIVEAGSYVLESASPQRWRVVLAGRTLRGAFDIACESADEGLWWLRPVGAPDRGKG